MAGMTSYVLSVLPTAALPTDGDGELKTRDDGYRINIYIYSLGCSKNLIHTFRLCKYFRQNITTSATSPRQNDSCSSIVRVYMNTLYVTYFLILIIFNIFSILSSKPTAVNRYPSASVTRNYLERLTFFFFLLVIF